MLLLLLLFFCWENYHAYSNITSKQCHKQTSKSLIWQKGTTHKAWLDHCLSSSFILRRKAPKSTLFDPSGFLDDQSPYSNHIYIYIALLLKRKYKISYSKNLPKYWQSQLIACIVPIRHDFTITSFYHTNNINDKRKSWLMKGKWSNEINQSLFFFLVWLGGKNGKRNDFHQRKQPI